MFLRLLCKDVLSNSVERDGTVSDFEEFVLPLPPAGLWRNPQCHPGLWKRWWWEVASRKTEGAWDPG
jgi:hypothetical protein